MTLARLALMALVFAGITAAVPVRADVAEVVAGHILPGYARFAAATAALDEAAGASCDPAALTLPYHAAFDAWVGVQHIRLGPVEEQGRAVAIAFWPDPKGLGAKAQRALLTGDPALLTPERFAEQSVAARGLLALERLLYPAEPLAAEPCALIRATTADLARIAAEVAQDWDAGGYGARLVTAGAEGNTTFLSVDEARQALVTQIAAGLEFASAHRVGRPLGSFDKPRPERAEARASGRSLRNVTLSVQALRAMVVALVDEAPQTLAALDAAIARAEALDDPVFAGVADPQGRLKVEILQQAIEAAHAAVVAEVAPSLGVGVGFNSQDGD